ncbi:MAG TPA: metallophosphoesterase [Bryobacteraceae bacterium]|nr:metallophosphoesterase [Bryobacteraceae bacterium]
MKLLIFSDIHGDYAALERLMAQEADVYIAAGDLTSWGRGLDGCGEVLRKRAGRVRVLPGNHESEEQIAAFCKRYGLEEFHGRSFEADGFHVAGLGYSSPTPFHTPGEYSEDEIARKLEPFAALAPLILVCHCPPLGTPLDRAREGVHIGSRAVAEFLAKSQPAAFFSGHVHEAEGARATLGRTPCWSPGKRGVLFDSDTLKT